MSFLTNTAGIVKVLHRFCVGFQLVAIVAHINPLVFHYLLLRKEKERDALTKRYRHLLTENYFHFVYLFFGLT